MYTHAYIYMYVCLCVGLARPPPETGGAGIPGNGGVGSAAAASRLGAPRSKAWLRSGGQAPFQGKHHILKGLGFRVHILPS